MTRRLIDYDPLTSEAVWVEFHGDEMVMHQTQDCSTVIEANKRLQNSDEYSREGMKKDWWHYASIPNAIAHKWLVEDQINIFTREGRERMFREKLSQPEWRYLKATTKKHQ